MRPRMRPGVTIVPTESGLFVRCGERELFVRGGAARAWFDRLRTVLDGTREVEEIQAGLGPGLTAAFPGVLAKLVEMDLVYDAAEDLELSPRVVDLYSSALVQLWDRCRRPNEAFRRYREGTLVVAGSPAVAGVVLRTSAERGLSGTLVLAEPGADLDALRSEVDELESGPFEVDVRFTDRLDDVREAAGVLYASRAGYHDERSRELLRYCQDRRIPFLTAGRIEDVLYLGPLSNVPGATCAACAAAYLDAAKLGDVAEPTSRDQLYVTVLGGLLASWWFCHRTGMPTTVFGRDLVSVDCTSFATTSHVLARRPDCPECGGLPRASALTARHERATASLVTDPAFGWFTSSGVDELSQVPLAQYEVVVNTRWEALGGDRPRVRVSAVSDAGLEARAQALGASLFLQSHGPADPGGWRSLRDDKALREPADRPFDLTQVVADSEPAAVGMGLCALALAREPDGRQAERSVLAKAIRSGEFALTDGLLELTKLCGIFAIGDVQVSKWRPSLPLPAWVVRAECAGSAVTVADIDESRGLSRCLAELLSSRIAADDEACRRPSELLALGVANDRFGTVPEWHEWLGRAEKQLLRSGLRVAIARGQVWEPLAWLGLAAFHVGLCRAAGEDRP